MNTEARIESLEAVVTVLRSDLAEAYRRIGNNQEDNQTTADRVKETGINRKALAGLLANTSNRANTHLEVLQDFQAVLEELVAEADHSKQLRDLNAQTVEALIGAGQAMLGRIKTLEEDAKEDFLRIESLEEIEDITDDMLDNLDGRIRTLETPKDDVPFYPYTPTPYIPTYPTGQPAPAGPWTTWSTFDDTGYETK